MPYGNPDFMKIQNKLKLTTKSLTLYEHIINVFNQLFDYSSLILFLYMVYMVFFLYMVYMVFLGIPHCIEMNLQKGNTYVISGINLS